VFGKYDFSLAIDDGFLRLGVEKEEGLFVYHRDLDGHRKKKVLGIDSAQIRIHPIEPITVPKQISRYLEIGFDPVIVGPDSKKTLYLTFPVEIGVFLESGCSVEVLDTFAFVPSKYSLYGSPKTGVITKWHRSRVYGDIPAVDKRKYGVLQLTIENPLQEFIEVSRTVFEGYGMVLYFDEHLVAMSARMSIHSTLVAETSFLDSPLRENMQKGIEILKAKKVPMVGRHKLPPLGGVEANVFLLEAGFV